MAISLPAHETTVLTGEVSAEQLPVAAHMLFGTDGGGVESDKAGGLKNNPAAGSVVALTGAPTTLTTGADTTLTFASAVRHVLVQNNTTTDKRIDFDVAASLGAILVQAGTLMVFDVPCAALHVWSTAADNLNGTVAGNFVVRGWA